MTVEAGAAVIPQEQERDEIPGREWSVGDRTEEPASDPSCDAASLL